MAGRVELQPGFVIHTRPYRETSLLLDVLTPDYGRVGLIARGAARPKSSYRPLLQPFIPLHVSWSGRGDLFTLTQLESAGVTVTKATIPLGKAALTGFYVNELVQRLTLRGDAHPGLFQAYAQSMAELVEGTQLEWTLRLFEKRLLHSLGYGLILDCDAETGEAINPDAFYDYLLEFGPIRTGKSRGLNLQGSSLLTLNDERFNEEALSDCKRLMRRMLAHQLGDRPLKSRELFMPR